VVKHHVTTYADATTRVSELSDIETALGTRCSTKVGVFRLLAFRRGWASGKSAQEIDVRERQTQSPRPCGQEPCPQAVQE
jgi:hypothetical protein